MTTYSYARYLSAKKSVDDRALNRQVMDRVRCEVSRSCPGRVRIVEIGPGLGVTIARLIEWNMVRSADYLGIDVEPGLIRDARQWLTDWGRGKGLAVGQVEGRLRIQGDDVDFTIHFVEADVTELTHDPSCVQAADLLIANAVLDLVELPRTLASLNVLLKSGGVCWLCVNYDGDTIFLPESPADAAFMRVYDRSMDERVRRGRPSGDSKTGRHLFAHLAATSFEILEAGASDWVVHASAGRYRANESHFLRHMVDTVDEELRRHADVPPDALAEWTALRHAQIERGELVLIVHQLDFAARKKDAVGSRPKAGTPPPG